MRVYIVPLKRNPETARAWRRRSKPLKTKTPIKATSELAKGPGPKRKKRIKVRNEVRAKKRFVEAFHSPEFVEFVHSLGCCIPGCRRTDIQAAHVGRTRARGGRWWEVAPLCGAEYPGHHQEQEGRTKQVNERYGVDLELIAAATAQRFMQAYGINPSDEAAALPPYRKEI